MTRLVIYSELLFGLRDIRHCVNGDVSKLSVPSCLDHASSIDKLVFTDQDVDATHS